MKNILFTTKGIKTKEMHKGKIPMSPSTKAIDMPIYIPLYMSYYDMLKRYFN